MKHQGQHKTTQHNTNTHNHSQGPSGSECSAELVSECRVRVGEGGMQMDLNRWNAGEFSNKSGQFK